MKHLSTIFILCLYLFSARAYGASMVYVPESFDPSFADVLVVIHGCLQSSEAIAAGAGWNSIADKENLLIVYPQVPAKSNDLDCWNWFLPENQNSHQGQLHSLKKTIDLHIDTYRLRKPRVYVTGISSGGAMVSGLLACYPKFFTSGAIHSGVAYGLVSNLEDGEKLLKYGQVPEEKPTPPCDPLNYLGKILVIQGEMDLIVNPKNADLLISQFVQNAQPTIKKENFNRGPYKGTDYLKDGELKARFVKIPRLGHAWSGSDENLKNASMVGAKGPFPTKLPFFKPDGPSSTNLILDFFKNPTAN